MIRTVVVFLSLAIAIAAVAAEPARPVPPSSQGRGPNPRFYEVQEKLDPGGTFYLYADLKGFFDNLADGLCEVIDQASAEAAPQQQAEAEQAKKAIRAVLNHSSLRSLEDVGVSVIPDGDLNRVRFFLRMPGEATGLRKALGGKPAPRRLLHAAPSSTVLFFDTDLSVRAFRSVIDTAYREAAPPEARDNLRLGLAQVEQASGLPVKDILDSLEGEMAVAVSFDDSGGATVPGLQGQAVQIPKPGLLVALQTRNAVLFDSLHTLFLRGGMNPTTVTLAQEARGFTVAVPPLGFPVLPTFAYRAPFFYLATDPRLLSDGLKRQAAVKGGLAENSEFLETFKDLPRENNGVGFVSARLYGLVGDYLSSSSPEFEAMAAQAKANGTAAASVRLNDPDGLLFISRTESGAGELVAAGVVAPLGITTAIAVPGFIRAREVSRRNSCQENLTRIDGAKAMWALENNKSADAIPTWDDLVKSDETGYLDVKPVCPVGGTYIIGRIDEVPRCTYQEGDFPHVYPTP